MEMFFEPFRSDACCLCGSTEKLTGEHKIKASALKSEFGDAQLVIGRLGEPSERFRSAQSVKSKALHFGSKLCSPCNSARTQGPDKEFDLFHREASRLLAAGDDPKIAFDQDRYAIGSDSYLNVFRYFAKLLCCHLADSGAPRRVRMARFALGLDKRNCIWLNAREDWTYKQYRSVAGDLQYASHGGLVVYGDKWTKAATGFHSTLTIGPLQYVYYSHLTWVEQLALRFGHPEFDSWCRAQVADANEAPMSEHTKLQLGLSEG